MKYISFIAFILISVYAKAQFEGPYWNREFHLGTNFLINTKSTGLNRNAGNFRPGLSSGYALKRINESGNGFLLTLGINNFSWKSNESDYTEQLGLPSIEVVRAKEFLLYRYSYFHLSIGYYKRIELEKYILEMDAGLGAQFLSFGRYRNIRRYNTGAFKNLADIQSLETNIYPVTTFNFRIGKRVDKKHILFLHLNGTGIFNLDNNKMYWFSSFNFGLNKDFSFNERKLKTGHRYRDNYLYVEGLGVAQYWSLNYERNLSKLENFRMNFRFGFGYVHAYDFIAGLNLVLGNRFERFEIAANYNLRMPDEFTFENPIHAFSTGISYRAETIKNWLFKLSLYPTVAMQPGFYDFSFRFGASIGKRFGKK